MRLLSIFDDIPEVLGVSLSDRRGELLDRRGAIADTVAECISLLVEELDSAGAALGLGGLEKIGLLWPEGRAVAVLREETVITLCLAPGRPSLEAEKRLEQMDLVVAAAPSLPGRAGPPELEELPPVQPPGAPARPPAAPTAITQRPRTPLGQLHSELRAALACGDLATAEELARSAVAQVERGVVSGGAGGQPDCQLLQAIQGLREGIELVQSRCGSRGLAHLRRLVEGPSNGQLARCGDEPRCADSVLCHDGLRWLIALWSGRAAILSAELGAATAAAESANSLAEALDGQARVHSLLLLAECRLLEGDSALAQALITDARLILLFSEVDDKRGLAASLLLEARVLAGSGRDEESHRAAMQAAEIDPSASEGFWLPRGGAPPREREKGRPPQLPAEVLQGRSSRRTRRE